MKRRSQNQMKKVSGTYSKKMESGNFMYGGFTNHLDKPDLPKRVDHRKGYWN